MKIGRDVPLWHLDLCNQSDLCTGLVQEHRGFQCGLTRPDYDHVAALESANVAKAGAMETQRLGKLRELRRNVAERHVARGDDHSSRFETLARRGIDAKAVRAAANALDT